MKNAKLVLGLCAALVAASAFAQATVFSQNLAPGDLFTNSGAADQGLNFGNPNWVYNNTRGGGSVGIRNNYPRSGNGSVYFASPGINGKADIEYFADPFGFGGNFFPNPFNPASVLGALSALSHLSYEWYRDSSSTAPARLHPVLRLGILRVRASDPDDTNSWRVGYLVFERANNGFGAAPTNVWQQDDILGSNYRLVATSPLGFDATPRTIPQWLTFAASQDAALLVISVNAGIGSGWDGTFVGAVDNITFGFNGTYTTYNFEVVPEPASMAALGSGLIGLLGLRRRKK